MRGRFSVALLSMALSGVWAPPASAERPPTTVAVEIVNQQNPVLLGGTVVPARKVTLAAQLPGRVEFIAGEEGDAFEANTAVVALDDDELLAQRQAAMAQMANADAALRNAGVQFNRELISPSHRNTMSGMGVPGLFDQMFTRNFSDMMGFNDTGMERHADLYARSSGVEQARSSFLQAKAQVEALDAKLRQTVGYAPFDGVIVNKMVEVGDTVQPGQPLLSYADTLSLQIRIEVPARLMPNLEEGTLLPARLDVRNRQVRARVAQIFPMADPVRHTVTVKLDLPVDAPAAPGMYAEVMLPDGELPDVQLPAIPHTALVQRGSLPTVCVVNAEGERSMRVVRVGRALDEERVVILSGLEGGERIVLNSAPGKRCQ
ncbi:MAG: efflux RND transporter periplasmic adaptor subunit [Pseudomonadota bacterium]